MKNFLPRGVHVLAAFLLAASTTFGSWPALAQLTENNVVRILEVTSGETYEVGVLLEGQDYYIDREYVVEHAPEDLIGSTLIKTANDDKNGTQDVLITFELLKESHLYVGYDQRLTSSPQWLANFEQSGDTLDVSDGGMDYFLLWRTNEPIPPDTYSLGGNAAQGAVGAESMYTLLIVPTDGTTPLAAAYTAEPDAGVGPLERAQALVGVAQLDRCDRPRTHDHVDVGAHARRVRRRRTCTTPGTVTTGAVRCMLMERLGISRCQYRCVRDRA